MFISIIFCFSYKFKYKYNKQEISKYLKHHIDESSGEKKSIVSKKAEKLIDDNNVENKNFGKNLWLWL